MYRLNRVRGPWQTEAEYRERSKVRAIAIEMEPLCLVVRLKGTRQRLRLPWAKLYQLAAEAEAKSNINAKRKRRSVRRGALAIQ